MSSLALTLVGIGGTKEFTVGLELVGWNWVGIHCTENLNALSVQSMTHEQDWKQQQHGLCTDRLGLIYD
uniref:Uncharacterized protein n=1 Tax=Pristionchus pacificus TaxID=54126 RepID=A0A2A6BC15_PRIPA|eukprot:PDM63432.1 hypothetical protein PRIPAC_53789 [Pristionchus pacificus]